MKVIITGMHRSGTSMLSGLLGICGLDIGSNFKEPQPDNVKGYYEDRDFMSINKLLLRRSGGGSFSPPNKITVHIDLRSRIESFLKKWRRRGTEIYGWKDPRACLTLKVWKEYIDSGDLRVVLIYRPFQEIAESLNVRNSKYSISKGLSVARAYWAQVMEDMGNTPFIVVNYHDLLKDPIDYSLSKVTLFQICNFLRINNDLIPIKEKIQKFIDKNLCHHRLKE